MAELTTVRVPDIGDFEGVDVAEILVAVGDRVEVDDPLLSLESDKATMDVPSPVAGEIAEVLVEVGSTVAEGDPIMKVVVSEQASEGDEAEEGDAAEVDEGATGDDSEQAAAEEEEKSESGQDGSTEQPASAASSTPSGSAARAALGSAGHEEPTVDEEAFRRAYASPSVRKLARELGVDLGAVDGSGRKGRITRDDVAAWVKQRLAEPAQKGPSTGAGIPPMPEVDFSKFGPVERVKLSKIRRVAAENLHRAWLHVPHVTQHDEADITELEAFRKSVAGEAEGYKLTPLAFILKACVAALEQFPDFNSSLSPDGMELIRKSYYHFGIAVDTPNGLVVPVIRDVDQKGVFELARELGELGQRTRERKVKPEDLQGASFSVSNLGGLGGTAFTPIVNAPEVAILGVSRTQKKPVWSDEKEAFEPRLMLPLSLSYDHRVIDGAAAARFTTTLVKILSDIRRLVL